MKKRKNLKSKISNCFVRLGIILSISLFLVVFVSMPVYGAAYYVAKNGDDSNPGTEAEPWNTIQKAAVTLVAGDTVYVKAGTYTEEVMPQNSGGPGNWIVYTVYEDDIVTINAPDSLSHAFWFPGNTTLGYIRVEKFRVRGGTDIWMAGIQIEKLPGAKDYIIIDDVEAMDGYVGISLIGTKHCEVRNCVVRNNIGVGIWITGGNEDLYIHDNSISNQIKGYHDELRDGTGLFASTEEVGNIRLESNDICNNDAWGINMWKVRNVLIKGNNICENGYTGIQLEGDAIGQSRNIVVDNNICMGNNTILPYEANIWIDDTDSCVVQNNMCKDAETGIIATAANVCIIRYNTIYNNNMMGNDIVYFPSWGIKVGASKERDGHYTYIVHNSLYKNAAANWSELDWAIPCHIAANKPYGEGDFTGFNILFKNNIVSTIGTPNTDSYDGYYRGSTHKFDYNCYYDEAGRPLKFYYNGDDKTWIEWRTIGLDTNSIVSDPLFVDPTGNENFHLQPTSPCIDGGDFLTRTVSAGTGSIISVEDAHYFTDGFGIIEGDLIQIGSNDLVRIIDVNYDANTITVDKSISWNTGDGVSYPYFDSTPDIGAYEYQTTGVDEQSRGKQLMFRLDQNYPNPFNPTTRITYYLPGSSYVTLNIYDLSGREIQTLVSEFQTTGSHSVNFDGGHISSGVYFYQLKAGNEFVKTRKMILMR